MLYCVGGCSVNGVECYRDFPFDLEIEGTGWGEESRPWRASLRLQRQMLILIVFVLGVECFGFSK